MLEGRGITAMDGNRQKEKYCQLNFLLGVSLYPPTHPINSLPEIRSKDDRQSKEEKGKIFF